MPEIKSSAETINRLMGGDYPPRDHRREAATAIEQADHMRSGDPITTTLLATANADAILALVEATERQTEQLRIGNLITLIGFQDQLVEGVAVSDEVLYRQIAERLGIA